MFLQENANCAWDSYRRLVVSYAKTVHRLSAEPFDAELSKLKDQLATKDRALRSAGACQCRC